jgi:hypothetical protein
MALCGHSLRYSVRCTSVLTEDDTLTDSQETVQLHQNFVLVLRIFAVHVALADPIYAKLLLFELDLVGVGCELVSKLPDVVGESCREQDDLRVFRGARECTG